MFFSTYVLTKKGPLAKVWLAAHWDKRLTKNEVKVVDLNQTVLQIVQPAVPIALRTSGELMLGCVRIYALKVRHLHKDATEATTYLIHPKIAAQIMGSVGVPLVGKGMPIASKEAITLEVIAGRAEPEQLCEADFNEIADILRPSKEGKGKMTDDDLGAWFAAEPSQFLEESRVLSQDDIAKMRADLLAFDNREGQGRVGSEKSTSKSTLSSMEKGRGADFPNNLDILDIGLPPPDDAEFLPPAETPQRDSAAGLDPFALHDIRVSGAVDGLPEEPARAHARRLKIAVVDTKDISMTREQLQKNQDDRHDIVCQERRHGPLDEEDARERFALRFAVEATAALRNMAPVGNIQAPHLREAFEAAMKGAVEAALAETEAARAQTRRSGMNERGSRGMQVGDVAGAIPDVPYPDVGEELPPMGFEYQEPAPEPEEPGSGRKRKRGQREKDSFSASTLATLETLRNVMKGHMNKVSFSSLINGKNRLEVARSFVDILVLASHGSIDVRQPAAFSDIALHKTDRLHEALGGEV